MKRERTEIRKMGQGGAKERDGLASLIGRFNLCSNAILLCVDRTMLEPGVINGSK